MVIVQGKPAGVNRRVVTRTSLDAAGGNGRALCGHRSCKPLVLNFISLREMYSGTCRNSAATFSEQRKYNFPAQCNRVQGRLIQLGTLQTSGPVKNSTPDSIQSIPLFAQMGKIEFISKRITP
jgi:hypothetical protein